MLVAHDSIRHQFGQAPALVRGVPSGHMVMYRADPEVIRGMLSHAPLVPPLLMPLLAPRVYARYARRLHGPATP